MPNDPISKKRKLEKASKALILLHGRGSTSEDILSLADEFCDDTFYVVAPQAPNNTWYPYSFMMDEKMNDPWLSSSVGVIQRLINEIAKTIPENQIFLMGFSQGACLALEIAARHAIPYGGVIAFTGGLIGKDLDLKKYSGDFQGTKVFIGNSDHDPHVPLSRSKESKAIMEKMGAEVTLKVYPGMPHTVNEDEIITVKKMFF